MRNTIGAPVLSLMLLSPAFGNAAEAQVVTPQEQACVNIPGNEFSLRFTSVAVPEGKMVVIDPDDMMLVNYPAGSTNRILTPRYNFMIKINDQLPAVPGMETRSIPPNPCTVEGSTITTLYHHLVHDHRIPQEQMDNAMKEVYRRRGIPWPGK